MSYCDSWYEKLKHLFHSDDEDDLDDNDVERDKMETDGSDDDDIVSSEIKDSLDSVFLPGGKNYSEDKNDELLGIIKDGIDKFFSNRNLILCGQEEIDSLRSKIKSLEQTIKLQQDQLDSSSTIDLSILYEIRKYMDNPSMEISVSDIKVKAKDGSESIASSDSRDNKKYSQSDFASSPAVYHFKRPSWYTPIKNEFNESNIKIRNASKTVPVIHSSTLFWKKFATDKKIKELPVKEKADVVDNTRKNNLVKLMNEDNVSNEERYIKYMLLTPGMPDDFLKIFTGAAHLGIDARILIEYFELPQNEFNYDLVAAYMSELQKGNDYNLRKEFAKELIKGEWYITSNENGRTVKYQVVPQSELQSLKKTLEMIFEFVRVNHDGFAIPNTDDLKESDTTIASTTDSDADASSAANNSLDEQLTDDDMQDHEYEVPSDIDYSTM